MLQYAAFQRPKYSEIIIGDVYFVSKADPPLIALADGLGSGYSAWYAANAAASVIKNAWRNYPEFTDLREILWECHQKLKKTRGAAAALAYLNKNEDQLHFAGIGNIKLQVFGMLNKKISSQAGIIGANMPKKITTHKIPFFRSSLGVVSSDGINLSSLSPAVVMDNSSLIEKAKKIVEISEKIDDRTVIVFRST